jgi:hypothetical protein
MSNLRDLPQPGICHTDLMLAAPGTLFSARGWIFELKYNGFGCLPSKHGDYVRMESRSGRDMAACFPELVQAIRAVSHDFVCDGELVVLDDQAGRNGTGSNGGTSYGILVASRKRRVNSRPPYSSSICFGSMVRTIGRVRFWNGSPLSMTCSGSGAVSDTLGTSQILPASYGSWRINSNSKGS